MERVKPHSMTTNVEREMEQDLEENSNWALGISIRDIGYMEKRLLRGGMGVSRE